MGARGRKPDQRREREREARIVGTLVFRGAHFAVPWRVSRVFNINIALCRRIEATLPPQDTYVFTKGVARLEGAVFLQTELALCLYLCNARPSPIRTGPPPYSTSLKPAGSRPSCRHWTTAERSRGWSGEARDIGRVQTFSEVWSLHTGFFRTV